MAGVGNALRAELYRLARSRGTIWLLLLPAIAGAARILGDRLAARIAAARRLASGDGAGVVDVSGFGVLADGVRAGAAMLTLLALLLGALALVRERDHGTLALSHLAVGRARFVIARGLGLAAFVVGAFVVLVGVSAGAAAVLVGLGDVVEEGFVMAEARQLWVDTAKGAGAAIPALVAAGWFGLAVSSISNTPGPAVFLATVPVFLFDVLKGLFPDVAARVFVGWLPLLSSDTPLSHLTDIARGYSDVTWQEGELLNAWRVPGAWAVALLAVAVLVTKRRSA